MATSDPEPFTTGEGVIVETEAEHKVFPPFDATTFASQLFWFAITFVVLYLLMSRVAIPQIGRILADRRARIADDLADAEKAKLESEAAGAAYDRALAEARAGASQIAGEATSAAKAEVEAQRAAIEADLGRRLATAEARIGEIKARALAEVGAIAGDAAGAVVKALADVATTAKDIDEAVGAALIERNVRV